MEKQGKKGHNREERETSVESLEDREISIKSEDREILDESHKDRESSVESQNKEEATPQLVEMEFDISSNWVGSLKKKSSDLSSREESSPKNAGKC